MKQDEIAAVFRAQELERRKTRQLRLMQNEAALEKEPLTEFDRAAHAKALALLKLYQQRLEKATRPGYWKRLWAALLSR